MNDVQRDHAQSEDWQLVQFKIERVQTYLFEVPELKAMVGGNTLLGETLRGRLRRDQQGEWRFVDIAAASEDKPETMRVRDQDSHRIDNLPALAVKHRCQLPAGFPRPKLRDQQPAAASHPTSVGAAESPPSEVEHDPLDERNRDVRDADSPLAAYLHGILVRDAGNLHMVFPSKRDAEAFLRDAQALLARQLPGVRYSAEITALKRVKDDFQKGRSEKWNAAAGAASVVQLPQAQTCHATGRGIAVKEESHGNAADRRPTKRAISREMDLKQKRASDFDQGKTADLLGLMRRRLQQRLQAAIGHEVRFPNDFREVAPSGHLAVIVADGNGIGARSRKLTASDQVDDPPLSTEYSEREPFFHTMRRVVRVALLDALVEVFQKPLALDLKEFDKQTANQDREQGKTKQPSHKPVPFRLLMLGGDDLLLACDAAYAMPLVIEYSRRIEAKNMVDEQPLHLGIGVAIVKNTFPFHRAHELAEQLSKSAKRLYRSLGDAPNAPPGERQSSTVDWLAITESWHGDLDDVRRRDFVRRYRLAEGDDARAETLVLSRRPYRILKPEANGRATTTHEQAAPSKSAPAAALQAAGSQAPSLELLVQKTGEHAPLTIARSQLKALAAELPEGRRRADHAVAELPKSIRVALTDANVLTAPEGQNASAWQGTDDNTAGGKDATFVTSLGDFLELYELRRKRDELEKSLRSRRRRETEPQRAESTQEKSHG